MSYNHTPGSSGPLLYGRKLWVTNPQSIYYGLEIEATGGHARLGWVMVEGVKDGQRFRCEILRGHLERVPAYEPMEGDIYTLEIKAGRFTIHRYDGETWQQLGAGHSEQDIRTLVAPMQFLWESPGYRRYYRPVPPGSETSHD